MRVDDFSLAPLLGQLAQIFRERGLTSQLARLEAFAAGYRKQSDRIARMRDAPYTSETIIELAAIYQMEPFADRYPLAPNDGRCPHCRAEIAGEAQRPSLTSTAIVASTPAARAEDASSR
jgi:hypothetical protein